MTQLVEKPLLNNFVTGALRIFGTRAGKLLKMILKGWSLAYRDFCVPRYVGVDEHCCEIYFENVAPEAFRSPDYIHCWHGVCLGVFDLEGPKDPVVEVEVDRRDARVLTRPRWD